MVCPFCASTNIASIKGQNFCVNCGRALDGSKAGGAKPKPLAAAQAAVDIEVKKLLKPSAKAKAVPVSKPIAATSQPAKPSAKSPLVSHFQTSSAKVAVKVKPKPAPPKPVSQNLPPVDISRPTVKTQATVSDIKRPAKAPPAAEKPKPKRKHRHTKSKSVAPMVVATTKPVASVAPEPAISLRTSTVIRTANLATALILTGIISAKVALLHVAQASSPGGLFSYLAHQSLATKQLWTYLFPSLLLLLFTLALVCIWLRASAIYAAAKAYDHRRLADSMAYRCGWNSTGSLIWLSLLGWLLAGLWLSAMILGIKGLDHLSLGQSWATALGVVVTFVMVLIGVWLLVSIVMARYLLVISGQSLGQSLRQAATIARRRYVVAASTLIGLGLAWALASLASAAALVVTARWIHHHHYGIWPLLALSLVLELIIFWWFWQWSLGVLMRLYRSSTRLVFGSDQAVNYHAGRRPVDINGWGVALSLAWWLLVASAATVALWHWRVDPTALLQHLATSLY